METIQKQNKQQQQQKLQRKQVKEQELLDKLDWAIQNKITTFLHQNYWQQTRTVYLSIYRKKFFVPFRSIKALTTLSVTCVTPILKSLDPATHHFERLAWRRGYDLLICKTNSLRGFSNFATSSI
jgi:hypothetical protein